MTCIEKYMQDHPDTDDIYEVVRNMCPSDFYYHHDPSYCAYADDIRCIRCMRCWTRELNMYGKGTCDCYDPEYERCNGTKERDKCSCNGNESQCDFYPEKRGETEKKTIYAHMPPFDTVEDSVSEATKSEEIEARCCGGRLIIGDEEVEHPDTDFPKILDSGNRREFETGAVRDIQEGKGRMDLLPWAAIMEVSKHCESGAVKYGEHNVDRGIPTHSLCDSAARHLAKYLDGWTDEPHLLAAAWNLLWAIQMELKHPEMVDTPWRRDMNDS